MPDRDYRTVAAASATVAGLWAVTSTLLLSTPSSYRFPTVMVALAIVALAGLATALSRQGRRMAPAIPTTLSILGAYLVLAPFAYGVEGPFVVWSTTVLGLVIAVLAGLLRWWATRRSRRRPYGRPSL